MQDNLQGDVKRLTKKCLQLKEKRVKIMFDLHPEFITKNGKKEFVVLPYEEFLKLQELLEDLEDLQDLRSAKQEEKNSPSISLAEVKKRLDLT